MSIRFTPGNTFIFNLFTPAVDAVQDACSIMHAGEIDPYETCSIQYICYEIFSQWGVAYGCEVDSLSGIGTRAAI
jgi:hypothetical protein